VGHRPQLRCERYRPAHHQRHRLNHRAALPAVRCTTVFCK